MDQTLENTGKAMNGLLSRDESKPEHSLSFFLHRAIAFADSNRSVASFITVLLTVLAADILFARFFFEPYVGLVESLSGVQPGEFSEVDIGFAPEVWQALLGMVLGTLILVISIASQSIPKLIDLYMKDLPSLIYIWFLIISGGHALLIKLYGEINLMRESSRVFNAHILMTICAIIAFPYIFYILRYTKPTNIIARIYDNNMVQINGLTSARSHALVTIPKVVEHQQYSIFEALNQFDDILEYVSFKELKADIIFDMSRTIQNYIKLKPYIHPDFFNVTPRIRSDISFKTMVGQFEEMEQSRSFYEQKCFRLLNNIYIQLLEKGEFDLSSMVAGEVAKIGLTAIECEEEELVEIVIIRFNTLLRMAIKHALRNNEPRNLYNLAFYYGVFITYLVDHKKVDQVKRCFMYLRMYGVEIARQFAEVASVYFIVAVIAAEMKKLLEKIYHERWELEIQSALVNEILQVDNPPDFNKEDLDRGIMLNNGVRWLQFGLALFYQREGVNEFVDRIAKDILDDLTVIGEESFYRVLEMTAGMLRFAGPTFWEDTDRGNLNIYYTSDQPQIDGFKQKLLDLAKDQLKRDAIMKYRFSDFEADLLWEMSRKTKEKELSQVLEKVKVFEKLITEYENPDREVMDALIKIREKLLFNSDNPNMRVTTTRQIASGTELDITGRVEDQKQPHRFQALVRFNSLNYLYINLIAQKGSVPPVSKMEQLTINFKPPRQKSTYQCRVSFDGISSDGMCRLSHTENVKIVEQQ